MNATTCIARNAPSAGAGNGLGGRATADVLAGYDIIVYTSGDQSNFLLGNGDYARDPSDDIGLLNDWFAIGDRKLLLTGDNTASAASRFPARRASSSW